MPESPNLGPQEPEYDSDEQQVAQLNEYQRRRRAEALRRSREQRKAAQAAQAEQHRQVISQRLRKWQEEIEKFADQGIAAGERAKIKKDALIKLELAKGNTKFADANSHANIHYIFVLLACIGVVLINFFLINAPVSFIAEQFGDLWMARITTVTVPIFLLLLEIYVSIQLDQARQQEAQVSLATEEDEAEYQQFVQRGLSPVQRWQALGAVMIAFTPLMILGTMLAWNEFTLYRLATTFGLIVLAGVTDAAIVFGGKKIQESLAFLNFHLCRRQLQRQRNASETRRRWAERQVIALVNLYHQTLADYNAEYPGHRLESGQYRQSTGKFIQEALTNIQEAS